MMFGNRLRMVFEARTLDDLRIGTNGTRTIERVEPDGTTATTDVGLVARAGGTPIVPATSLKGALRAATPDTPLLGAGGAAKSGGGVGRLWLEAWTITATTGMEGLTRAHGIVDAAFERTGVRIDRTTGSAEDKKLYTREWVAKGATLVGQALLFLDGADEQDLLQELARLLEPLVTAEGLPLGADRRQGSGRIQLVDLEVTRLTIDPGSLDLVATPEPNIGASVLRGSQGRVTPAPRRRFRLKLTADGPFLSIRAKEDVAAADGTIRQVTQPLSRDGRPWLWPSSLLGALRSRAAWLAELARLRGDDRFAPGRSDDDPMDDPDRVVRRAAEVESLSAVERVFGVTGWRGLLAVRGLAATDGAELVPMTSVSIDRFTGGALNQKLFTTEVFVGAHFEAELSLEARGAVFAADEELFDLLVKDIDGNGLELGHGAAKGFGWFDVEVQG